MKRPAFTLIDLSVVLLILVIALGVLVPSINIATEAGRRMMCDNNLKQQVLSCLTYEQTQKTLPSGGWSVNFVGDPDRGFGKAQPGAWTFSLLPFMGQDALFQTGSTGDGKSETTKATSKVVRGPLREPPCFVCPSRGKRKSPLKVTKYLNSDFNGPAGSKTDYAANYGSTSMDFRASGCSLTGDPEQIAASDVPNGLIYDASAVTLDEIRDGTTNTYLTTEKFICSDQYNAAGDGDQASMYAGVCGDARNSNFRSAGTYENAESPVSYLPTRDASSAQFAGKEIPYRSFGGPHVAFGVSMSDGSVQEISYEIDPLVHANLANRKDHHEDFYLLDLD